MPTSQNHHGFVCPDDWWQAAKAAAESAGITQGEWIRRAIWKALLKAVRAELSPPVQQGRPKETPEE